MTEFDENDALAFIRENAGKERLSVYSDDDLLNIIDMIWDYYEINGMLDVDFDAEDEEDEDTLLTDIETYVKRMLKKDRGAKVQPDDIKPIVQAELAYENSLETDF